MNMFCLPAIILYRPAWGQSPFGLQLLNFFCNLNKYVIELAKPIKIQYTQINVTYVLTTKQAKYKKT